MTRTWTAAPPSGGTSTTAGSKSKPHDPLVVGAGQRDRRGWLLPRLSRCTVNRPRSASFTRTTAGSVRILAGPPIRGTTSAISTSVVHPLVALRAHPQPQAQALGDDRRVRPHLEPDPHRRAVAGQQPDLRHGHRQPGRRPLELDAVPLDDRRGVPDLQLDSSAAGSLEHDVAVGHHHLGRARGIPPRLGHSCPVRRYPVRARPGPAGSQSADRPLRGPLAPAPPVPEPPAPAGTRSADRPPRGPRSGPRRSGRPASPRRARPHPTDSDRRTGRTAPRTGWPRRTRHTRSASHGTSSHAAHSGRRASRRRALRGHAHIVRRRRFPRTHLFDGISRPRRSTGITRGGTPAGPRGCRRGSPPPGSAPPRRSRPPVTSPGSVASGRQTSSGPVRWRPTTPRSPTAPGTVRRSAALPRCWRCRARGQRLG